MKYDFTYHNPTRVHFGKNALEKLPSELSLYGECVLLVYGKGSVKRIGLYDKVTEMLKRAGKRIVELPGIKSNPTYSEMMEGAQLVRENGVDLILALGGGSVIDVSKAISVAAYCEGDPWEKYWEKFLPLEGESVPVGAILTMSGTASEMNSGSVITHEEKKIKEGRVFPPNVNPRFSIINPEYTYSVPKEQMVSGIFDIMSHLLEQYLSGDDENVSDFIAEGIMRALISAADRAMLDPCDYEARSNISWCATTALNRTTGVSKMGDWNVHGIEHQVGAYTDCPHGIGLAIVSLPYYRMICPYGAHRFARLATSVFGITPDGRDESALAKEAILALEAFIDRLGIPKTLRSIGATEEMLPKIAASVTPETSGYKPLTAADVEAILRQCY